MCLRVFQFSFSFIMTSIQNFPEEVLIIIFEELLPSELRQCQQFCRSWYFPAHVSSLFYVKLTKAVDIERFINSIDHNPDPRYLNAVREININGRGKIPNHLRFDKATLHKLFFRFPKLDSVTIFKHSSLILQEFNDELCNHFLTSCPNLEKFQIPDNDIDEYYERIYRLRLLTTSIYLGRNMDWVISRYRTISAYLCSFPRLQTINGFPENIPNLQAMLPVLQQAPNIHCFPMGGVLDDHEGFAERYLESKTQQERDTLLETLSNITEMSYERDSAFCVNSLLFVSRYCTGLNGFAINNDNSVGWTEENQRIFSRNVLDLICSARKVGSAKLEIIVFDMLAGVFPDVLHRVFNQAPPSTSRTLKLSIRFRLDLMDGTDLDIRVDQEKMERNIRTSVGNQLSLEQVSTRLFREAPALSDIDTFILDIDRSLHTQRYSVDTTINMYTELLKGMHSLKTVILDIPTSFTEIQSTPLSTENMLSLVDELTLLASPKTTFHTLLDRFSHMFPNLNQLNLYYTGGTWWDKGFGGVQLGFAKYTLKKLTVDMTPLKKNPLAQSIAATYSIV